MRMRNTEGNPITNPKQACKIDQFLKNLIKWKINLGIIYNTRLEIFKICSRMFYK